MANRDVLSNLLRPADMAHNSRWQKFLETVREDVLWNPNSDGLFQSLDFKFSGVNQGPSEPSLHIHTAPSPNQNLNDLLQGKGIVNALGRRIHPVQAMELEFCNLHYRDEVRYEFLKYEQAIVVSYFLEQQDVLEQLYLIEEGWQQNLQARPGLARHLNGKSVKEIIAEVNKRPGFKMTGKIILLNVMYEKMGKNEEFNILLALIQDTVFQKIFIFERGLKVGVIV